MSKIPSLQLEESESESAMMDRADQIDNGCAAQLRAAVALIRLAKADVMTEACACQRRDRRGLGRIACDSTVDTAF